RYAQPAHPLCWPSLPPLICFFPLPTLPPEISTLSLHDALPILVADEFHLCGAGADSGTRDSFERRFQPLDDAHRGCAVKRRADQDRKSTRLNSSHGSISYAVFCLKKKIDIRTRLERQYDACRRW